MPRSLLTMGSFPQLAVWLPCLLCGCVFTSERPVEVDVKAEAATAYVFRGQTMTDRPVLQPSSTVHLPTKGGGTTSLTAWGNFDLDDGVGDAWFDGGHAGEFTEIDLTAAYAHSLGDVDLVLGLVHYTWPNGESFRFGNFPATAELLLRVSGEVGGFTPSVELRHDIDEVEGLYARAAVARAFALTEDVTLLLDGGIGWSDDDHSLWLYRTSTSALADARLEASLLYTADEITTLHAGVRGSTIVDDDLRDWFSGRIDADTIWFTAGVSWMF